MPMVCDFCLSEDSSQGPLCHVLMSEKACIKLTQKMYSPLYMIASFQTKDRGGRDMQGISGARE